jgi:UDP-2,3-diacylglucosamine hydrolase
MDHLFISDVHLGAFSEPVNRELEEEVISLVHFCRDHHIQLHILGDLFDYWMEYPDTLPSLGEKMLSEFEAYNMQYKFTTYILGNHDNWTRGYFEELGFLVSADHHYLKSDNKTFFLHHGDGLSDPDYGLTRPLFHRILRSGRFTKFFQMLFPPDAGLHLMKNFSAISREKFIEEPEKLNKWSKSLLNNSTFDYVICGHDHIARMETFPFGTYINPGAFYKDHLAAYYTNNELKLVKWSTDDSKLVPTKIETNGLPA